ncbi:hypothetical protein MHM84_01025 [Halomonas sp. McH1-25]|uniref:hypothetical protein n=1 Tax=unclassified Halomonas TaxID=2609666 RepID=UPI001EF6F1F1|nr:MULTISPECIES: hypothetical protein [unclassified Halomonas]MCG7598364.1 hypothetical protein [Halomonas sp. McH1-25]MCP1342694.1 hypothetical protein [Halomonas sp. FL8]MCP1363094.1 hypothetical protein [Halomonas sp. BBD45]MCP1367072.1 hypothetical protein [Halomonas sp. BBD48]
MHTAIEWQRVIERNKHEYRESDAEGRAWLLESWQRHHERMTNTAAAWERLRNASPEEIAEHRSKAADYAGLIEWAASQPGEVQKRLAF